METAIQHQLGVLEAIRQRRAVRNYIQENPGDDCIRGLLEAAVCAPTAMHLEPWAFVVVQDRALLKRYSDRAKAMVLDEHRQGEDARISSHLGMLRDPGYNIFYDSGTLVVICRKANSPFADADCWLAAENLMLAAVAGGLGTCCIGFALPVLNAPDVKRELGIPEEGAAVAPILLGRVRGTVAAVPRRPPEILRWVR
jgi:nitroreductase